MVYAFVLLKTGAGTSPEVTTSLLELDGVLEAHVVAGTYDVIVEVEAEEVYDILDLVSNTIQSIDGVLDSKTYITLE